MAKKGKMSNEERRLYIIQLIEDYVTFRDKKNKELTNKYFKKLCKNVEIAVKGAVDEYYEYPTEYDRKESFYDVCKVKYNLSSKTIKLIFSSNPIEQAHKGKGDYIYEWMFGGDIDDPLDRRGGWHGGDIEGPGHPDPMNTPWLRKAVKVGRGKNKGQYRFRKGKKQWLREAARTDSPYLKIWELVNEEIELQEELLQTEFDDLCFPKLKEIRKQVSIYTNSGD